MQKLLNSALIICTRNRPVTLFDSLSANLKKNEIPKLIIVVDSSPSIEESTKILSHISAQNAGVNFCLISSNFGLPNQRNTGIDFLCKHFSTEEISVTHFLDDDIYIEEDYFGTAFSLLMETDKLVALGGVDPTLTAKSPSKIRRALLGEPIESGRIGVSGLVSVPQAMDEINYVDWIQGGMMNIKTSTFNSFRFEGKFRMFGEDVEASIRLRKLGDVAVSKLVLVKHQSEVLGKSNGKETAYFSDAFRMYLTNFYNLGVKKNRVLLSSFCLGAGHLVFGIVKFDPNLIHSAYGHLSASLAMLFHKELKLDIVPWGSDTPGKSEARQIVWLNKRNMDKG